MINYDYDDTKIYKIIFNFVANAFLLLFKVLKWHARKINTSVWEVEKENW